MSSSFSYANPINIYDGANIAGFLDSGGASIDFLGYTGIGATSPLTANLFNIGNGSSPADEAAFFDTLAGLDVGLGIQVQCTGADLACQHDVAVSAATTYFSLKLGNMHAFFKNLTGFVLALTYDQVDGEGAGLSHVTLYGNRLVLDSTPQVPLPAGILLLISALGGLRFLSRFRKAYAEA